jgi:hypothetical protein
MKYKGPGSDYLISRAVEEPLEATFELGERIQTISKSLMRPLVLGIIAYIVFVLMLVPSVYQILLLLVDEILSRSGIDSEIFVKSVTLGIIMIFLFSIVITSLIYLIQIYKFNAYLLQRYSLVTGLTGDLSPYEIMKGKKHDEILNKDKSKGKLLKNPIYATLDLIEESMHELSQIIKLIRFCIVFTLISMIFLLFSAFLKLAFNLDLIYVMGIWELILGSLTFILFVPTLKLLMDSESHFNYLRTRHSIIDGVRFEESISVPVGKDQLDRLVTYLTENDPYIESSILAQKERFKKSLKLNGLSGKEHEFDAYFLGTNVLKERSVSLYIPMGKFAVFVKVFKDEITLEKVHMLRDDVIDVCRKDNTFPLRIIALQWKIEELKDEVYEFVLENPIEWKRMLTHIQVMAEDGDIYSFIPMISYGKGVR